MDEYRSIAPHYDMIVGHFLLPLHRAVTGMLLKYRCETAIDLCCGTGQLTGMAGRAGIKATGVDRSPAMLRQATHKHPAMDFHASDATELPFADNTFDAATISFALHEKTAETGTAILHEARRVVHSDGVILVVDYQHSSSRSPWTGLAIRCVERLAGKEHHTRFRHYMANGGTPALFDRAGLSGSRTSSHLNGWAGIYTAPSGDEGTFR